MSSEIVRGLLSLGSMLMAAYETESALSELGFGVCLLLVSGEMVMDEYRGGSWI